MGGAGVAGGDYTVSAIINPANAPFFRDGDDFGSYLGAGAVAEERNDFVDVADELRDRLDRYDRGVITAEGAREISGLLSELSRGGVNGELGAQFSMAIPNELASAVFFARQNALVSAAFDYSDADREYLEGVALEPFTDDTLTSTATVSGYAIREAGIALGRRFATGAPEWELSLGATPKYQRVETIEYTASAGNYDAGDLDDDAYTAEGDGLNLDLGAVLTRGGVRLGLAARNLVERDYETVNGNRISTQTQVTAGAGYNGETLTALLDLDLTTGEFPGDRQARFARAGFELDLADWTQLRIGYRHDLEGNFEDAVSAGIGFSPFDVLHLHVAALKSSGDTLGASVDFGVDL